jgi:hypothetical protein
MLYNLVTIEVPVYITVANIDAPTGAHAIAEATNILDIKSLIDRIPRQYSHESKPGSIVSILSNNIITSGYSSVIYNADVNFDCTYGVSETGNIYPSVITSREELLNAYGLAMSLLTQVSQYDDINSIKQVINDGIEKLKETQFHIQPVTPEDQLSAYLNSHKDLQDDDQVKHSIESDKNSLVYKLKSLLNDDSASKLIKFKSPIFISSDTQKQNDDTVRNGFSIQFGEIGIYNDEKLIGAIGTWKEFANSQITYFDDESDINTAREVMLLFNNLPSFFYEKPNLSEKLECSFDFTPLMAT